MQVHELSDAQPAHAADCLAASLRAAAVPPLIRITLGPSSMATGRGNQLTKQVGEYLVAAELARRGYVAATFSGNVPDYDIVATDIDFNSVPVQVKAIGGKSWQLDIRRFVDVRLEDERQIVGRALRSPRRIACVMVAVSEYGADRFPAWARACRTLNDARA